MKIAYVFQEDAADPTVDSGRPASILRELGNAGVDLEPVFPVDLPVLPKILSAPPPPKTSAAPIPPPPLALLSAQLEERARREHFDLIFSPGTEIVSRLRVTVPLSFCAPATFGNLVDYYPAFTGLSEEQLRAGHAREATALKRARLAVYPSEWAARSAIDDYHADPAGVAVIPFGANLGHDNLPAQVRGWIDRRPMSRLRLIFIGRDWHRQGGDQAIAIAIALVARGQPVTLDVVGTSLPPEFRDLPWIRSHGLLSPRSPSDLRRMHQLLTESHFAVLPARAETFGLALAEANAYGVPAVATRTGGTGSVVLAGHTGLLLPPESAPSDFAGAIHEIFSVPGRYRAMCHRAFAEFEHRLNWRVFARKFLETVEERLSDGSASPPPAAAGLSR